MEDDPVVSGGGLNKLAGSISRPGNTVCTLKCNVSTFRRLVYGDLFQIGIENPVLWHIKLGVEETLLLQVQPASSRR